MNKTQISIGGYLQWKAELCPRSAQYVGLLEQQASTAKEELDRLRVALHLMLESHGMHGPCRQNNCSECKHARKKAQESLSLRAQRDALLALIDKGMSWTPTIQPEEP